LRPVAACGIRLRGEQGADGLALVVGKLAGKGLGVDGLLALAWGHFAEIENSANEHPAARGLCGVQLLNGIAPLLALRRGQAFEDLVAIEHALALLRRHAVEFLQLPQVLLLQLGRQFAEAGLVLQLALLLGGREIAVVVDPLLEMLVLPGPAHTVRTWSALIARRRGAVRLENDGRRVLLETRKHRRCGDQQQEGCAKTKPEWTMRFHDAHDANAVTVSTNRRR